MPLTSPDFSESSCSVTEEELAKAAEVIRGGGIVAFPTETFYGLAVDPFNGKALARLFQLKQRSENKPVLVLIDQIQSLGRLVTDTPAQYRQLIAGLWPGPLTLVFSGLAQLPVLLTDAEGTVGVRLSSHPVARRLATAVGGAITGTSANPSGLSPAVTSSQVNTIFPTGVDHIIDGGLVPGGLGSSIIGVEGEGLKLIRAGSVPFELVISMIST